MLKDWRFKPFKRARLTDWIWGVVSAAICLIAFVWVIRSRITEFLEEPIPVGGDGSLATLYQQLFLETGGSHLFEPLHTNRLGWPERLDYSYFPMQNWIEYTIIRLTNIFVPLSDPTIGLKAFAILKTIPVAASAWIFGRTVKLSRTSSSVLALTFSLSTFAIVRSLGHFGLGFTWSVPLTSAVIIAGWKSSTKGDGQTFLDRRSNLILVCVLMLFCGLSGFYFVIFASILFAAALITLVPHSVSQFRDISRISSEWRNIVKAFGSLLTASRSLLIPWFFLLVGFLLQTVPVFFQQRQSPPLVSTAARGWTEAIVYSGTLESLFYDVHALAANLASRNDILNFLQTRATWEARQIGAVAGISAYLFLLTFVMRTIGLCQRYQPTSANIKRDRDDFSRIWALLIVCLTLYLVGPASFGLSRTVFPFIRAWGRLAPFITLFLVALLLLAIQRLRRPTTRFLLVALIVFVQLLEVNFYRKTFPDGRALAAVASETRELRQSTIDDLASKFATDCPIAQLPIYPFPEYDSPNDSNGDYGLLDLPLVDDHRFRWSYGAIKNTDAARHYAPFVSQQPPFARISLGQQIQYWAALRPCGAVIDRTYLYVNEQQELDAIQAKGQRECARPLKGEKFKDSSRFVLIDFSITACQLHIGALTQQLVTMANSNEVLWQPMTLGIERFERYWAMIPAGSPHQLMYSVRGNRTALDVRISVLVLAGTGPFANQPLELCVSAAETSCHSLFTNSAGLVELPMTLYASDELHSMLSVSIAANSDTPLEWGAILLPSNPNSAN